MDHLVAFNVKDVVSMGFEARCVGPDGSRYLWHGESGLRVDTRTGFTSLVTDPTTLPESLWFPTRLGIAELDRIHGRVAERDRVHGGVAERDRVRSGVAERDRTHDGGR